MAGASMDAATGALIEGWADVVQSLRDIFTTDIGTRLLRRTYGALVPRLLGENLTPATVLRFITAVIVAIELWEPRFRVKQIDYPDINTPERLRLGALSIKITGVYRPRGHLGDETADFEDKTVTLGPSGVS